MTVDERLKLAEGAEQAARLTETSNRLEGEKAIQAALDAQRLAQIEAKVAANRARQLAIDLANARSRIGTQVPADELVFIASLPVRVEEIKSLVGGTAAGTVMTVTDNQLAVDASLSLEAAPLVKQGMSVTIDEQALGVKATGRVAMVAGTPGTRGVDGFHVYFEVKVDATDMKLDGVSVRLTIPIKSTQGAVTAVPNSALSLAADGTSRVQVKRGNALAYVSVTPGLSADGYVEVTPTSGKLEPGDLVVVGYNNPNNPRSITDMKSSADTVSNADSKANADTKANADSKSNADSK